MRTDPKHYFSAEDFALDNQVTEFLRKLDYPLVKLQREKDAEQLFLSCEAQNCASNSRISRFNNHGPFEGLDDLRIREVLSLTRKIASEILGKLPSELEPVFGPGATLEDRGRLITVPDKISSRPTITPGARCLLPFWERTAWARALVIDHPWHSEPKSVRGNRFTTVPKDALKLRGICVEPSLNVSLQLAVGKIMKGRLRRFGLDLSCIGLDLYAAQPIHKSVARAASKGGAFATIDLSNASDTLCLELVRAVLPSDWFDLLYSLRSPYTWIRGKRYRLEKFSSMGNGYTFELETLVFASMCRAIALLEHHQDAVFGRGLWVFGDDLIVPTTMAESVVAYLSWAGFKTNPRKTFLEGPFRESCGGDFFDGIPVRAYYQKEDPDEPQKTIAMANGLYRSVYPDEGVQRPKFLRAWHRCLDSLPTAIRKLRGPPSLGDLVIHDSSKWTFKETSDGRGFIRTYSPISTLLGWEHWKPHTILASALYGIGDGRGESIKTPLGNSKNPGGVSFRDNVSGFRLKWIPCLERESQKE
jgi:hypothetical protein